MTAPAPTSDPVATLAEEVAQLRDLFQRRLFEDKAKNRLYEELHDQLTLARGGLTDQLFAPVMLELLLVVDRVSALNTNDDVVLESIVDELLEVLERRGVRRVPEADVFDPSVHEAVGTLVDADRPAGAIVNVVRPGYLMGRTLLRAERVVVVTTPRTADAFEPMVEAADTADETAVETGSET